MSVCLSLPGLAVPGHAADMTRLSSGHPEPEGKKKKRLANKDLQTADAALPVWDAFPILRRGSAVLSGARE